MRVDPIPEGRSPDCTYGRAYHPPCGRMAVCLVDDRPRCQNHFGLKCQACSRTATRECPTDGSLGVCGAPLCDDCRHCRYGYGHRKNDDESIYEESPMTLGKSSPYPEDHAPLEEEVAPLQVGDWVLVWGSVKKTSDMAGVHPEDTVVTLWSHNADYDVHVRNDHLMCTSDKPPFARTCTSMFEVEVKVKILGTKGVTQAWVRCEKNEGHPGVHQHSATEEGGAYQWSGPLGIHGEFE